MTNLQHDSWSRVWGGIQESVMSLQEEIVGTQEGTGINQLKIIYIIYPVHT